MFTATEIMQKQLLQQMQCLCDTLKDVGGAEWMEDLQKKAKKDSKKIRSETQKYEKKLGC